MRPRAVAPVACLLLLPACSAAPAPPSAKSQAPTKTVTATAPAPPPEPSAPGGSPDPPAALPAARTCQAAEPYHHEIESLPGQVNGTLVQGAEGLGRLRRAWGNALVVIRGGDFSGQDLRGVALHNICFISTELKRSDLRGIRARGIGFVGADLTGARLEGARMEQVLFSNSNLRGVQASGADFSNGVLSGSALSEWENLRLDGADLRGFQFQCGKDQSSQCAPYWRPVSFRGADLRGAVVDTYWGDADWTGARLADTQVSLRQVPGLGSAKTEGSILVREGQVTARLSSAEFRWLSRHISLKRGRSSEPPRRLPPARWMRPGRSALFVALPLEFDSAARASALYRRLLPAAIVAARSYVVVKVNRDRSVTVTGDAEGVNYHWCEVSGPPLRLDRRTGWYGGPAGLPPAERGGGSGPMLPVLRLWGDRAEIYREGQPREYHEYFQCGARAFFHEMTRINFPPAEAVRLWEVKEATR